MRRLLPHNSGRIPERMAASPTPLPAARTTPGVRRETPESIAISRNLEPVRGKAAALPTFHHGRRDAVATATMRSTDEASRTQVSRFQLSRFQLSRIRDFRHRERHRRSRHLEFRYPSHLHPPPCRAALQAVCVVPIELRSIPWLKASRSWAIIQAIFFCFFMTARRAEVTGHGLPPRSSVCRRDPV